MVTSGRLAGQSANVLFGFPFIADVAVFAGAITVYARYRFIATHSAILSES
jgi:hypothetical protein